MSHRRIAIIGTNGSLSESYHKSTELLFRDTGNNTGNLIFQNAFARHVKGHKDFFPFSFDPDAILGNYDVVCLPAANFLYSGFDLGDLATRLERCKLPIVVVGLGMQAFRSINEVKLQPGTERLLSVISEYSESIGVRGHYTASILERYGVENFDIIGCPSNFTNLQKGLGTEISKHCERNIDSIAYSPTFYSYNSEFETQIYELISDRVAGVICQDPIASVALARGERSEELAEWIQSKSGFLSRLDDKQKLQCVRMMRAFFSAEAWMEFYRGQHLILGSRIHGVNAGWQAGRPAFLFSYDLRTEELAQVMGIPFMKVNSATVDVRFEEIIEKIKQKAQVYDRSREVLVQTYGSLLRGNHLELSVEFASFFEGSVPKDVDDNSTDKTSKIITSEREPIKGFLELYNRERVSGWVSWEKPTPPQLVLSINGNTLALDPTFKLRPEIGKTAWSFQFELACLSLREGITRIEVSHRNGPGALGNSPVVVSFSENPERNVLVGKAGYLFLKNDSNDFLSQISGHRLLRDGELHEWAEFFRTLDAVAAEIDCHVVHVVAPAKESVLEKYLPDTISVSNRRPALQLRDLFETLNLTKSCFSYPLAHLQPECTQDAYTKGDSHWSDIGAESVCKQIIEWFAAKSMADQRVRPLDLIHSRTYRNTDLLSKLGGVCIELQPTIHVRDGAKKTSDNGVQNTGNVRKFSYERPSFDQSMLMFHDSFGEWMMPFLSVRFAKSTYCWQTDLRKSFITAQKPQLIIVERAERFLIRAGSFDA